jgi:hypothetical protein
VSKAEGGGETGAVGAGAAAGVWGSKVPACTGAFSVWGTTDFGAVGGTGIWVSFFALAAGLMTATPAGLTAALAASRFFSAALSSW